MRRLMSALLVAATASAIAVPTAASASVSISAYGSTITVFGHGFGHGRGMGQYGAFGYATNYSWNYHQILDHYYAGSVAGTVDPANPLATMKVRLIAQDKLDTILTNDSVDPRLNLIASLSASPAVAPPYKALLIQPVEVSNPADTSRNYNVYAGPGCGGPWTQFVGTTTTNSVQVTISPAVTPGSAAQADLIGVCEPSDIHYYRGDIAAVRDSTGPARTINILPLDAYVRGVVPRESPASWGDASGGKGMAALQAQAVAARSYAYASTGNSYSRICDSQSCQVYGGVSKRSPAVTSGALTTLEDPRSDTAVSTTANEVRMIGANVVATEYSSSTGGNTAPGTFPSVVDDGDAVAANTNHVWTHTVPRSLIESAYPSIGTLINIQIKSRNGIGDLGGRVNSLNLQGTSGSVSISGWDFSRAANSDGTYRVLSDWFQVVSSALTSPAATLANGPSNTFYVATTDGGVLPFNGAQYEGSMLGTPLNKPIVSMTVNATGSGYWLLGADGGVFSFNVPFYGSTGGMKLNAPVFALAARPQGDGYWFVASDGGVFSFGSAPFEGSMGGQRLNKPVVGIAPTQSGTGYWLVASDGGIFTFGDAKFFGSTGSLVLNKPIVAMAARPQGDGYWLVGSDGGVFTFGNAGFLGSAVGQLKTDAVAISSTSTGLGYRIVASDGTIVNFGDAT